MRFIHFADRAELTAAAAGFIAARLAAAVVQDGLASIALAGGSTPRPVYAALVRSDLPWERIRVFFGDERTVPPDDERSNFHMAQESLLDHIPLPAANLHRIRGELGAEAAAQDYIQQLSALPQTQDGWPRLDLILLGMGPDGHTASLFPGHPSLNVTDTPATATPAPPLNPPVERVTLTLPALCRAKHVLFLAAGEDKLPIIQAIQTDPETAAAQYPAARVRPQAHGGGLTWFVAP